MADGIEFDVDYKTTLRNLARLDDRRRKELKVIVKDTSLVIKRRMRSNLRNHRRTGRLYNSISAKNTRPKMFRPISKEDRGLFKSVHPRNKKGGRHQPFLDSGTRERSGGRGSVTGIRFRERARESVQGNFNTQVKRVANRNETV
jgi:hypothetical protein